MKHSIIKDKSFEFSLYSLNTYKKLVRMKEFIIAKQLFRSSTSIGANVVEALNGSSTKDFIAKLKISLREAHETKYWIELLRKGNIYKDDKYENHSEELIKILTSIIKTTSNKLAP